MELNNLYILYQLYFAWELFKGNKIGSIGSKYIRLGLYKLILLTYLYFDFVKGIIYLFCKLYFAWELFYK